MVSKLSDKLNPYELMEKVRLDHRHVVADEAGSWETASAQINKREEDRKSEARGRPAECVNKVRAAVNPSSIQSCFFLSVGIGDLQKTQPCLK